MLQWVGKMARSIRLAMPLIILVALIIGGRAAANHYGWELNSEFLEGFSAGLARSDGWDLPLFYC